MNPFLSPFLNPVVFFALLFILLSIFMLVIRSVSDQDKKSQDVVNKAVSEKDTLEKGLKQLQEEIGRLNSELSLKTQMFEGLKGQYDELEKDYEKLVQKTPEPNTSSPKNTDAGPKTL
jgi:peptidoglycan hydrolase CwlO-like protein